MNDRRVDSLGHIGAMLWGAANGLFGGEGHLVVDHQVDGTADPEMTEANRNIEQFIGERMEGSMSPQLTGPGTWPMFPKQRPGRWRHRPRGDGQAKFAKWNYFKEKSWLYIKMDRHVSRMLIFVALFNFLMSTFMAVMNSHPRQFRRHSPQPGVSGPVLVLCPQKPRETPESDQINKPKNADDRSFTSRWEGFGRVLTCTMSPWAAS